MYAGPVETYVAYNGRVKETVVYEEKEVSSVEEEEDLEDAFFKDWKAQQEEDRQKQLARNGLRPY
jgi:hypothetical protein